MVKVVPPAQLNVMDNIIDLVNLELGNRLDRGSATAIGDGITSKYLVAPPYRYVVNDNSFMVYVDDEDYSDYGTMDYDTGIWSFDTSYVPALSAPIKWEFNYYYWPEAQVFAAINAGITNLFPAFYRVIDETITPDGSTQEFELGTTLDDPSDFDAVIGAWTVEGSEYSRLRRTKRYEVFWSEGTNYEQVPYIRFYEAPSSGEIRVKYVARPKQMDTSDDNLSVPVRAVPAVISYACYHLLSQQQAPRLRTDIAIANTGGGNLSPRQMNDAANAFYLRFQMQREQAKMRPWWSR